MAYLNNIYVTLETEKFNVSEVKEYFINPNCFGDDFGEWLMRSLLERNVTVEKDGPDQEDFGWYVNFEIDGDGITCLIIYDESERVWRLVLEYNVGLVGSILGKRNKKVGDNAVLVLAEILESEPEFNLIRWSK